MSIADEIVTGTAVPVAAGLLPPFYVTQDKLSAQPSGDYGIEVTRIGCGNKTLLVVEQHQDASGTGYQKVTHHWARLHKHTVREDNTDFLIVCSGSFFDMHPDLVTDLAPDRCINKSNLLKSVLDFFYAPFSDVPPSN